MPRKARKLSSTHIYHVVIKGADRQLLFEEDKDYIKYLDILQFYKEKFDYKLYAYCLMSNHVHLLIDTNLTPISTIFRHINTNYATWFNLKYDRTGFLQNGRFYSEPIENTSYFITVLKYIHFNPTKAGLEQFPGEKYTWSSFYDYASSFSEFKSNSYLTDTDYLIHHIFSLKEYLELHQTLPDDNCLEINTKRRRIPDDVARDIIYDLSDCRTITDFQYLPLAMRKQCLLEAYKKGISVRQLNRLTGIPRGVISRLINHGDTP